MTINLGKSAVSLSKSDSDRFCLVFFSFEDAIGAVYFSLALGYTTHHEVQFVMGMYQWVNSFAFVGMEIHNQYTRAESRFSSCCQFQVFSTGQIPILSTQLTLSHCFLAPKR